MIPLDPAFAEQSGCDIQTMCRCCLRTSQRDAEASRNPEKARRGKSKLSPERAFFCLSPEGKPSGRRPMAALPRRTDGDKASCRVRSIVVKRSLFSAALAERFVYPDTNGNRETCCNQCIDKKRSMLLLCVQSVSDNRYEQLIASETWVALQQRTREQ